MDGAVIIGWQLIGVDSTSSGYVLESAVGYGLSCDLDDMCSWSMILQFGSLYSIGNHLNDPKFLNGMSKSRSFRDALSRVSTSSEFLALKITTHHGLPSLWISDEEMLALATPSSEFSVTLLNSTNVLIKLMNDLDYCRVFSHSSYFSSNCMKLFKWTPHFDVNVESPIIPIWISIPNLRPHLFSPRILHDLGSLFGRPLQMDNANYSNGTRSSVARVLDELDVTKCYTDQLKLPLVDPPITVNVGDMAELSMQKNVDKVTNVVNDNTQGNACVDLSLHETVAPVNAGHVYSDVGQSVEPNLLVSGDPLLPSAVVLVQENLDTFNPILGANGLPIPVVNSDGIKYSYPFVDLACSCHKGGEDAYINDLVLSVIVVNVPMEIVSGSFHEYLNGVNMGLCDVNTVVLNDSSSGLLLVYVDSPVVSVKPPLSPCTVEAEWDCTSYRYSNYAYFYYALKAQLVFKSGDNYVDQSDWMDGLFFSLCGDGDDDMD
ncbi:hypothetical protein M5K25_007416 [Dendrobium thyrsiflorum]|uniref:DUF4283 domain-containing protein n=1 Tax=Dendrobium thyrsiflorum TaxID=117978 RepID=A0ABD0VLH7_DENTH